MPSPRLTDSAQAWIAETLRPGDAAVDATAGRGWDTAFLARCVGPDGAVLAFDTQAEALIDTRARLEREELDGQVVLVHAGHETFDAHSHVLGDRPLRAAMFNLGYLPGTAHDVTTTQDTTLAAIRAILAALAPGGRLAVMAYRGHPGGMEESAAVASLLATLDPGIWTASSEASGSPQRPGPVLHRIERKGTR